MPLKQYGVLKGQAIERRLGQGKSPHYQIHLIDDETDYRIAVNVLSKLSPHEVEYLVDDRFQHPITAELRELRLGFTELDSRPGGLALDFIRGNLFDREAMRPLPFNVPGPDNDLNEKVDHHVQRAMADEEAVVYAFGQRWGPEARKKDRFFRFLPGNGIHDIHMNQGNSQGFRQDDGVWQDGGVLIHFPTEDQWVGIFLKFQSQGWHTDDRTGHRIGEEPVPAVGRVPALRPLAVPLPTTDEPDGLVRIVAALVNTIRSPEQETVTLLNTSPQPIDLARWAIADRLKNKQVLSGTLGPGQTLIVPLAAPVQLSNNGGIITLLDDQGLKVAGVSYTREQAQNPGWTIVF
jgi:uncharacterized protein YukJ